MVADKKDEDRNITDADRQCPQLVSCREDTVQNKELKTLEVDRIVGKTWKIVQQIEADLGFNTIYVVENTKKNYLAALKIEQKKPKMPLLKFELFILLQMEQKQKTKQFCRVFDRGTEPEYNWIVVTLCGKSLRILRKETKEGKFTPGCAISVATQCLKALEEFHKVGFIHRSVNPSEFAIGRIVGEDYKDLRNIYMLDYGFARQYREADGTHKPPRPSPWKYMGALRHAPRNAYLGRELSRLDDLEMWFYMIVEFIKGSLPWVQFNKPKEIFEIQKTVRSGLGLRALLGGLPSEYVDIMKEIDKLQYKEEPNYAEIYNLLDSAMKTTGGKEFPYDWEEAEIAATKEPPPAEKTEEKGEEKK